MGRLIRSCSTLTCGIALVAPIGCQHSASPDSRADLREAWQGGSSESGVVHPQSVTVARGPSPLAYQVQQAGILRVIDTTDGNDEVAAAEVAPGSLVWVSEDKGVFVNDRRIRPGPLAAGHSYAIEIDAQRSDVWRSGVESPRPRGAASRPARPSQ